MRVQKKSPSGLRNREGAKKNFVNKPTKPIKFPQEPLLWQAHRECIWRVGNNPSPINRTVAQIIATHWKEAFVQEVCK